MYIFLCLWLSYFILKYEVFLLDEVFRTAEWEDYAASAPRKYLPPPRLKFRAMHHKYYDLYFTTATILEWKYLLQEDVMKDIVIDSFRFLIQEKRAVIYGFVIMSNHLHVVWQIPEPHTLTVVKSALLSYTAHQFKRKLIKDNPDLLANYRVNLKDRVYQFWERNPLSVAIYQDKVFLNVVVLLFLPLLASPPTTTAE